jgi:hypothetical protein
MIGSPPSSRASLPILKYFNKINWPTETEDCTGRPDSIEYEYCPDDIIYHRTSVKVYGRYLAQKQLQLYSCARTIEGINALTIERICYEVDQQQF